MAASASPWRCCSTRACTSRRAFHSLSAAASSRFISVALTVSSSSASYSSNSWAAATASSSAASCSPSCDGQRLQFIGLGLEKGLDQVRVGDQRRAPAVGHDRLQVVLDAVPPVDEDARHLELVQHAGGVTWPCSDSSSARRTSGKSAPPSVKYVPPLSPILPPLPRRERAGVRVDLGDALAPSGQNPPAPSPTSRSRPGACRPASPARWRRPRWPP